MMNLTPRQLRLLLWTASAALAAAVVCVGLLACLQPLDSLEQAGTRRTDGPASANRSGAANRPLESYSALWERDLRRPLFDPAPVEPVKIEPPKPILNLRLVGTAIDAQDRCGFFEVPGKGIQLARPGEKVGEALVKEIAENTAVVEFNGGQLTLKIEAEK